MKEIFKLFDRTNPNFDVLNAAKMAYRLMFFPQRKKLTEAQQKIADTASMDKSFQVNEKLVEVYQWNQGASKKALLVHGFGGHCLEFNRLIEDLSKKGFHIYGFDAPAHGNSDGKETDIGEFMECIKKVSALAGLKFDLVAAHSFGSAALTYEMTKGSLLADNVLFFAPNATFDAVLNGFLKNFKADEDDELKEALSVKIAERFKTRMTRDELWAACTTTKNIARLNSKKQMHWQILHGRGDAMFGVDEAEAIKAVIPNAELHLLDGIGHNQILTADESQKFWLPFFESQKKTQVSSMGLMPPVKDDEAELVADKGESTKPPISHM